MRDIQKFIATEQSFGGFIRGPLYRILPDLMKLQYAEPREVVRVRNGLGALVSNLKKKNHHKSSALVAASIRVIKEIRAEMFSGEITTDNHTVTDHAFCAAIRRLGYDIEKYKDAAMEEALEHGLIPVMSERHIVTFLPNRNSTPE
jgi:hypothetical protein